MSAATLQQNPHRKLDAAELSQADVWAGKIALQMLRGNRLAAHDLVDSGLAALASRDQSPALLRTPLSEVGVAERTCNALERQFGATTLGGLLNTTVDELLAVPQLGPALILGALASALGYTVQRILEMEAQ